MTKLKGVAKVVKTKAYKSAKNNGKKAFKGTIKTVVNLHDLSDDRGLYNSDIFENTAYTAKEIIDTSKKAVQNTKTVYRGGKKVAKGAYNATKTTAKATTKVGNATVEKSTELARKLAYKSRLKKNKEKAMKKQIVNKIIKIKTAFVSTITGVNSAFLIGAVVVGGLIICIILLVTMCFSIFSGAKAMPNIEDKETVIRCMQSLDEITGKQLIKDYSVIGEVDEDWKAVLSLTLGKYDNDLSEVNMSVGESVEWTGTYADIINEASRIYNVDSALICSVINAESGWIPNLISNAGAKGLMQLIDSTFQSMMPGGDPFNPRDNIMAGTKYLRSVMDIVGNDIVLIAAGYNAGPGAVVRWGYTVPPYTETQIYVRKVSNYYPQYKAGILKPEEGVVSGEITMNESNFLSEAYNLVNVVSSESKLIRKSFEDALDEMELTEEQKELAQAIYEADLFDEVFGKEYDYKFNIIGNKIVNADANGEVNGVPLFLQYKEPWASHPYSGETIAAAGCGTTTMAMVASWASLKGKDVSAIDVDKDKTVNPIESADFATSQGYACNGSGSYNTVVTDYVRYIGCKATYTLNINNIIEALSSNKLVVINVGGGVLSGGGHFMLGVGIKDGMIMLNDPGRERQCYAISGATYSPSLVAAELKNAWIIELE